MESMYFFWICKFLFRVLRLFFQPNFPGPTSISCSTSIPESRVSRHLSKLVTYIKIKSISRGWGEKKCTDKFPFYIYFKPNFRHLHEYFSQNWSSEGHFEVLDGSVLILIGSKVMTQNAIFSIFVLVRFCKKKISYVLFLVIFAFFAFLRVFHFVS